jgi:hypothetical protein
MLTLCVVCGFLIGIPFAFFQESLGWPTFEMSSRGEYVPV